MYYKVTEFIAWNNCDNWGTQCQIKSMKQREWKVELKIWRNFRVILPKIVNQ